MASPTKQKIEKDNLENIGGFHRVNGNEPKKH